MNIAERRTYAYTTQDGRLQLLRAMKNVPGASTWRGEGAKTRVGVYSVTAIHQDYTTSEYNIEWSKHPYSAKAAFGAYAVMMGPDADGQWMHGTVGKYSLDTTNINVGTAFGLGSHGCIRHNNANIEFIAKNIRAGTPVVRIYAAEKGGSLYNRYDYTDTRRRTFYPEEARLEGPKDAPLWPRDALKGGEPNALAGARRAGLKVSFNDPPPESATPQAQTPAKGP